MGRNEAAELPETTRSIRAATGLTQIEYAEAAGLATRTFAEVELVRRGTFEQITKAARVAGIPGWRYFAAMERTLALRSLSHFRLSHRARKGRIA